MIPYGRQDINAEDINAVVEVLKSDYLTQGPIVPKFEKKLIDYTGAKYCAVVNSATSGLHIACMALGLGPGDWLWTSPNTFVASSNAGLYCGAKVDFVDINPKTFNLDITSLEQKLEKASQQEKLPKVVVLVHFSGLSVDMKAVKKLSDKYGFRIIEDASHAVGSKYNGKPVGSCEFSDMTVFSFHPVKIITTAEGGAVLTNNKVYADDLIKLRSHGITRDVKSFKNGSDEPWYYEQQMLGYNYRLTDLHAALGVAQMNRLDSFVEARNQLAARYKELLKDLPLSWQEADTNSAYHLFVICLKKEISKNRRQIFEDLKENGIGAQVHYIPVYHQPYYKQFEIHASQFPNMETYYKGCISLPLYPALTLQQQDEVVEKLKAAIKRYS